MPVSEARAQMDAANGGGARRHGTLAGWRRMTSRRIRRRAPGVPVCPFGLHDRAARLKAGGGYSVVIARRLRKSGRLQIATLIQHGLYPSSKVLDVGCGPFARRVLAHELPRARSLFRHRAAVRRSPGSGVHRRAELVARSAQPRFAYNDDFDLTVFGTTFDFVLARIDLEPRDEIADRGDADSFVKVANPQAVMLAPYLPASRFARPDPRTALRRHAADPEADRDVAPDTRPPPRTGRLSGHGMDGCADRPRP